MQVTHGVTRTATRHNSWLLMLSSSKIGLLATPGYCLSNIVTRPQASKHARVLSVPLQQHNTRPPNKNISKTT